MAGDGEEPRVAPLRWMVGVENGEETHYADSVVGRYVAWGKGGRGRLIRPCDLGPAMVGATVDDAKAAAWADYEARILGALVPRG